MFGCHLRKGEKGAQIIQYMKTSQGNHTQPVTNILVKS